MANSAQARGCRLHVVRPFRGRCTKALRAVSDGACVRCAPAWRRERHYGGDPCALAARRRSGWRCGWIPSSNRDGTASDAGHEVPWPHASKVWCVGIGRVGTLQLMNALSGGVAWSQPCRVIRWPGPCASARSCGASWAMPSKHCSRWASTRWMSAAANSHGMRWGERVLGRRSMRWQACFLSNFESRVRRLACLVPF